VRLLAKFFLIAWLVVALTYLPAMAAEAPVPDTDQSARLTDYLHAHRLPLVGAQVLDSQSGRSVLLYGYTATDFGKNDAETKARRFLRDNEVAISNRIRVRPELLSMKSTAPAASSAAPPAAETQPPDVEAYKNQQQNAEQQRYLNQQAQAYMNQGNTASSMASALIPLLGMGLAIGLGGGGSSFGMGVSPGFGSPYGSFGSSPYGSPYGGYPYGSPYGSSPYGSPYGTYPYGGPSTYP
jgi:hypothetical protein